MSRVKDPANWLDIKDGQYYFGDFKISQALYQEIKSGELGNTDAGYIMEIVEAENLGRD